MANKLSGKKVAILAADGFEEVGLTKPRQAFDDAGAKTTVVSITPDNVQGMNAGKGETVAVDQTKRSGERRIIENPGNLPPSSP